MTAEEFLKRFSDPTYSRYDLTKQCVRNGWRYATDARILCRIKTNEPDCEPVREDGSKSRFPDVAGVMKPHEEAFGFPSEFSTLTRIPCKVSNDTGLVTVSCDRCGGSGICECRCGDEHDCGYCDGVGHDEENCEECWLVIAPGVRIAAKYEKKIADIPGAVIRHLINGRCSLFLFEFDGMAGQGLVCHHRDDNM